MHAAAAHASRFVYVRADPGEDLLNALEQAVAREGVVNGAILCGVGSLSSFHVHVVGSVGLPPTVPEVSGDGPFDILTVTGGVLGGRVHAHLTFSDTERAMGGHLHHGSTVLTFAIVLIADTGEVDLASWDRVGAWSEVGGA